jgi:hypothetical protein
MQRVRISLASAGLAVLVAGALAAPAAAATPATSLSVAKAAEVSKIDARLFWSGVQGFLVARDKHVPSSDRKALLSGVASDSAALKVLRGDVQKATSIAGVTTARNKVADLAIFEFALPRIVVVRDSDNLAADAAAFTAKEAGYQSAIDKAAAAHKPVGTAQKALADFKNQVVLAEQLATNAHTAIDLVRGASGARTALAHDAAADFGSALHILAAIRDAHVINRSV